MQAETKIKKSYETKFTETNDNLYNNLDTEITNNDESNTKESSYDLDNFCESGEESTEEINIISNN